MTPSNRPAAAAACCDRCGGSGVLRLDDQRFRTCLDCLGQGHRPALPPAPTTAGLRQGAALEQRVAPRFSAERSASVAR